MLSVFFLSSFENKLCQASFLTSLAPWVFWMVGQWTVSHSRAGEPLSPLSHLGCPGVGLGEEKGLKAVMTLTLQCDNVKSFIVTYKMMCFHLKARVDKIWNEASCSMNFLGSNSAAPSSPCFSSSSHFIPFVVALSFKSSLHQRITTRRNGCWESCSSVNWSISARLEPADGVACRHYYQQRPV